MIYPWPFKKMTDLWFFYVKIRAQLKKNHQFSSFKLPIFVQICYQLTLKDIDMHHRLQQYFIVEFKVAFF